MINALDYVSETHLRTKHQILQDLEDLLEQENQHFLRGAHLEPFTHLPYKAQMVEDDIKTLYIQLMGTLDGGQGVMLSRLEDSFYTLCAFYASVGFDTGFEAALEKVEGEVLILKEEKDFLGEVEEDEIDDIVDDTTESEEEDSWDD